MLKLITQSLADINVGRLQGPGADPGTTAASAATKFQDIISKIIGVLTISAILWFLLQFILGAIAWINAGGDPKAIEAAHRKIMNSLIGLVVVIFALVFTSAIGGLLGIDILQVGRSILKL